jgi:transcriptional regulator with XRE-family HTH domain
MTETNTANMQRGQAMKKHRRARGWTQEQLAIVANVTVRTIQRLESGDSPAPETLMAVAQAFGMKAEQLNSASDDVSGSASRRYVHLLPQLATIGDLVALLARAHQFQFEHDEDDDARSVNAMKEALRPVSEAMLRLHGAGPEEKPALEAELSRELEGLQNLGYYLFGIVRVLPRFFDEHVLLLSLATIYICDSRSPKIVKANNILVLPAILPEEVAFNGSPALASAARELHSDSINPLYEPALY